MRIHRVTAVTAVVLTLASAGVLLSAGDEKAPSSRETISANAVSLAAGPGPNSSRLTAWVDAYTSDEESKHWVEIFRAGGQDALVSAWQKEKPVAGRARFAGTLAYDLRVARSRPTETGRKLFLVTDRPLSGFEVRRGLRSTDYPIAWIELDLDAKGKGTGRLIPAAELTVENGALQVKSLGVEPIRLLGVSVSTK